MGLIANDMLKIRKFIDAQQYVEASDYLLQIIDRKERPASEITDLIRELVAAAVRVRDQGNYTTALKMMDTIWRKRTETFLCIEILVICVNIIKDFKYFLEFEKTIPSEYQDNPHISLFLAGGAFLAGDLQRTAGFLQRVPIESVRGIPSFSAFRQQLVFNLSGSIADLLKHLESAANEEHFREMARDLEINRYVTYLRSIEAFPAFEFALVSGILYPAADVKIPTALIADIAIEFRRQLPADERNVVLFRLLVAFKITEAADAYAKVMLDSKFVNNADFVKQLFKLSELDGMARWRTIAIALGQDLLGVDLAEFNWRHPNAGVQHKELSARILSLKGAGENEFHHLNLLPKGRTLFEVQRAPKEHVFIGMFGQCRFSNHVFPTLMDKLATDIEPLREEGMTFSYGIATWDRGGSRGLFDTDSVHFLLQHLPFELHDGVMQLNCKSVGDVKRYLPNLVSFCAGLAASESDVTVDYLRDNLLPEFMTDIWTDVEFMSSIGQRVADRFGGNSHLVNQARMWNRIAALRALADKTESEKALPITRYLLLRSDLVFSGASLLSNLLKLAESTRPNFLMGDHDPHANFIEGLGDRIMLCDRQAFGRITAGQQLFLKVVDDASMESYISRCHAHQFLETILFEQDTQLIRLPWEETRHEIYRGRLTMEQVQPYLLRDISSGNKSLDHLRAFV
ncbi:hypothetical protein [Allorhizobium taibaishanense]|uniref:Uncharacterized protein n=1 Tax=Allorhizobium taibaishanense TaxID=887144 RepID=A0A1Q9A158_9HYPH|nr:hypothetical protein [Allorhizobium taibaishanense]MBB4007827.1 hypothetical protein [Allorhizobium taibaishanense]OLP48168.1 hypothetical protein BJF91_08435 [Allorhizobium taibaishanense]